MEYFACVSFPFWKKNILVWIQKNISRPFRMLFDAKHSDAKDHVIYLSVLLKNDNSKNSFCWYWHQYIGRVSLEKQQITK